MARKNICWLARLLTSVFFCAELLSMVVYFSIIVDGIVWVTI